MVSIRRLGAINRTYRHLTRYRQILRILFKYGFHDLVDYLHIDHYLETGLQMINRTPREQIFRYSRPERLRMGLEELGPTFIKLGQLLSSRPDFISPDYLEELRKLQDNVPPFSYQEVQQIFQEDQGKDPQEIFSYFSTTPLAAASIGQVHLARISSKTLNAAGYQQYSSSVLERDVVVKVQRPGLENIISVDLEILSQIAKLMEDHFEEVQGHQPTVIVEEFALSLSQEIDFTIELSNIHHFSLLLSDNPNIHVPEVFPDLSTERILVMERVKGIKASHVLELKKQGYDLPLIAERGANLVMEQIFVHGFFHADPHPGNLFILPGNIICFIDFGQMGRLLLKDRENFTDFIISITSGNEYEVVSGILKMTIQKGEVDHDRLALDISDLVSRYMHLPIGELELEKVHLELLKLLSKHRLFLKPNLYLMFKALATVEGVGMMLAPELEILTLAQPFMKKIKLNRVHPRRLVDDFATTGYQYLSLIRDLPGETRSILTQLRQGRMKIEFKHRGLLPLERALYRVSNRIAFAIVLAAQIVGSSLIVLSGIKPHWHDIPVIGLAGFLIAGIMGFWLLISILRRGKL
ncbi:MAG: AarF/ABC1/UbiB kinase family protein [Candidatus Electrothrix aestuarii]|uniref:AarF/ABC1/UbiB kinase family protein n=1 Tax=Candidatus Electrothrix aestuarii TaxID=3062594 RepID=A0AAU8LTP7_9BACT|nr:AarF/ABC1/UbiB kinase family protein [Candidatus Electrothrix aestuarii]